MIVSVEKYVIVTKDRPIEFHYNSGEMTEHFKHALLYKEKCNAEFDLAEFDNPDDFEILKVEVSCIV